MPHDNPLSQVCQEACISLKVVLRLLHVKLIESYFTSRRFHSDYTCPVFMSGPGPLHDDPPPETFQVACISQRVLQCPLTTCLRCCPSSSRNTHSGHASTQPRLLFGLKNTFGWYPMTLLFNLRFTELTLKEGSSVTDSPVNP